MDIFFIFPWFLMSYYVPFKFLLGFLYVPHIPNVFPSMFSIAPHFYPIGFDLLSPIYLQAEVKELYTLKYNLLFLQTLHSFKFF